MFGFSKIFRSRWRALFWSAGILWLAIEVAAPDPTQEKADLASFGDQKPDFTTLED